MKLSEFCSQQSANLRYLFTHLAFCADQSAHHETIRTSHRNLLAQCHLDCQFVAVAGPNNVVVVAAAVVVAVVVGGGGGGVVVDDVVGEDGVVAEQHAGRCGERPGWPDQLIRQRLLSRRQHGLGAESARCSGDFERRPRAAEY